MIQDEIDDVFDRVRSGKVLIKELHALYEQRQPVPDKLKPGKRVDQGQIPWLQENIDRALHFTECALKKEEFLLVCDVSREAIRYWETVEDSDIRKLMRVRINYATALARLGYTHDARIELERLINENSQVKVRRGLKGDILRQLGNIHRDESQQATSKELKLHSAKAALDFYLQALKNEPDHLETHVMVAGASLIAGFTKQAHEAAEYILNATEEIERSEGLDALEMRWKAAAHAALGQIDAAAESYGRMQTLQHVNTIQLADARFNARFLAEALGKPHDLFDGAFPPLEVVVFVGHLPDRPGMPLRFPHESIDRVRQAIRNELDRMKASVGLVSAAAGADLLFIEAMLERGGTVHLVLPWSKEKFLENSVRTFEPVGKPAVWEPLFKKALAGAQTIREIGEAYDLSDVARKYAMEVTAGLALQTARASRLDVRPVALRDVRPGWATPGTTSFVELWRDKLMLPPVQIPLPPPPGEHPQPPPATIGFAATRSELDTMQPEVKSMLIADIVGYSRLPEQVIPAFVSVFMSRVSLLVARSKYAPRSINTWGDAVYAVFDYASHAGAFALELTQMVYEGKADWEKAGLYYFEESPVSGQPGEKHTLNIRIGLHTGPVFRHFEPVVRHMGFTGAHVSRAARIEPVAKPGEAFASEQFAAMAELDTEIKRRNPKESDPDARTGFVCQFAGTTRLAKGYPGLHRLYRVMHKRVFAIEELAHAIHERFCESAKLENVEVDPKSIQPWKDLTEDLRDSNRAQALDIHNKLRVIGYELVPTNGMSPREIKMTEAQIEDLAKREHERWLKERADHGWRFGPKRDRELMHHPLMIPWEELKEVEKEKSRRPVRTLPSLIEKTGLRVKPLEEPT